MSGLRVALYDDPLFREHDSGFGHPERPERLDAFRRGLRDAGLEEKLRILTPRPATSAELLRVHTEEHVAHVASTRGRTVRFDPDTQAGPRSYEAALAAAGAVVDAVDRVLDGEIDRAFCAVRPPGHHASADRAMGFCLFNNVAAGGRSRAPARPLPRGDRGLRRAPRQRHPGHLLRRTRACSTSRRTRTPSTRGRAGSTRWAEGAGRGFTVNLPLPGGLGRRGVRAGLRGDRRAGGPKAFDPELVLVSAASTPTVAIRWRAMALTHAGYADLIGRLPRRRRRKRCGEGRGGSRRRLSPRWHRGGRSGRRVRSCSAIRAALAARCRRPRLDALLAAYRRASSSPSGPASRRPA